MARGQFSIDFFLVLSVIIAFSIMLYGLAVTETGKARLMDSAVMTKAYLDSISASVDFVYFSGGSSRVSKMLFQPAEATCLYFDDTQKAFFCRISSTYLEGSKNRVFGRPLFANLAAANLKISGCGQGWNQVLVVNDGTQVLVTCSRVS